ncbi:MAG TPA: RNA methyltransferase [Longimicrobiales bacterium]|nr:RNA methyltransferase [Longimicrobiales bacterium]
MPSRSRASLIRGLSRRKNRDREGLFLAEGVRVVEDLLDSSIVPRLAVVSSSLEDTPRGRALAERLGGACELERVSDAELSALADTQSSQGVVVAAETPRATLADLRARPEDVVLLLDAVQDPGNAGTLIRTADALGCVGVIVLPGTVDPWNPKVVRAASGSLFRLPIVETDPAATAEWVRAVDGSVLAGDARGTPVHEISIRGPVVLAVGNEGAGLSLPVATLARTFVSIPIRGAAESLNVGIAAGILLYEVTRRLADQAAKTQ